MVGIHQMILGSNTVLPDATALFEATFSKTFATFNSASFASQTSTGPHTFVCVADSLTEHADTTSELSVTFGGNSMSQIVGGFAGTASPARATCVTMWYVSGAQSGSLNLSWTVSRARRIAGFIVSLDNLQSATALDTDTHADSGSSISLANLNTPGAGGIRLVFAGDNQFRTHTYSNATKLGEASTESSMRTSGGYDIGDDGSAIGVTLDGTALFVGVGASFR